MYFFAVRGNIVTCLRNEKWPKILALEAQKGWTYRQNTPKIMQHAQFRGFGLGNARKALRMLIMQCRCYQHWLIQPQILPTALTWRVLPGSTALFEDPKWTQHAPRSAYQGPPISLLMPHLQASSTSPRYVEVPKSEKQSPYCVDDARPKNCRKPFIA